MEYETAKRENTNAAHPSVLKSALQTALCYEKMGDTFKAKEVALNASTATADCLDDLEDMEELVAA